MDLSNGKVECIRVNLPFIIIFPISCYVSLRLGWFMLCTFYNSKFPNPFSASQSSLYAIQIKLINLSSLGMLKFVCLKKVKRWQNQNIVNKVKVKIIGKES